jgi:hypothetical protein
LLVLCNPLFSAAAVRPVARAPWRSGRDAEIGPSKISQGLEVFETRVKKGENLDEIFPLRAVAFLGKNNHKVFLCNNLQLRPRPLDSRSGFDMFQPAV